MKTWFENKSVALVGNASSLFDLTYGEEIDSHDVVVRINKAAMLYEKFDAEKSHGKRTDIWMFWRTAEYRNRFDKIDKTIKKMHMGHQDRRSLNMKIVDFVYPDHLYEPLKKLAGPRGNPTTGFIAIDYILHCEPKMLSVYGFDWKKTPTYTDPSRKIEARCPHDYDVEKAYCLNHIFTRPNATLRK
jgi:hypothetical protein